MSSLARPVDFTQPLKLYWQPGCTACLRMKEFFTRHGVHYESINVLADGAELEDLVKLAGRHIPIARRGDQWADGQVLTELATIGGIDLGSTAMLTPPVLVARASNVLATAARLTAQVPEAKIWNFLPDRPRTYMQLVAHIVQIVETFVDEVETGRRLVFEDYHREVPPEVKTRADMIAYVNHTRDRLERWWDSKGKGADFSRRANVYYGEQTLHQFLERMTWHSTQHCRQLALVVETLGARPDRPLGAAEFEGLPLPDQVWDDQMQFRATA